MSLSLGHHGMLAEINKLLGALYYYEKGVNTEFYVNWLPSNSAYINKNKKYDESLNIYDLYFKQPFTNKIISKKKVNFKGYRDLLLSYKNRKELANVMKKYIYPIDKIDIEIKNFLKDDEDSVKIGCHIRGRRFTEFDFLNEIVYGSCKDRDDYIRKYIEQYFLKIKEIIKSIGDKKYSIYVFTDNKPALDMFKTFFKNKLKVYDDIIRSNRFFKAEIHTDRTTDKLKCGYDIVKEVFTMLKMDYFISAKYGNIPLFVVNGNNKLKHIYVD